MLKVIHAFNRGGGTRCGGMIAPDWKDVVVRGWRGALYRAKF